MFKTKFLLLTLTIFLGILVLDANQWGQHREAVTASVEAQAKAGEIIALQSSVDEDQAILNRYVAAAREKDKADDLARAESNKAREATDNALAKVASCRRAPCDTSDVMETLKAERLAQAHQAVTAADELLVYSAKELLQETVDEKRRQLLQETDQAASKAGIQRTEDDDDTYVKKVITVLNDVAKAERAKANKSLLFFMGGLLSTIVLLTATLIAFDKDRRGKSRQQKTN